MVLALLNQTLAGFRGGFKSFRLAIFYRSTTANHWDPNGCFWEEINSGYYLQYIYPYDEDYMDPTISKERQLRLNQHPPDLSLKR